MESSALHLLLPLSSCPSSFRSCSWTPSSRFHPHPPAILNFKSRSRARFVARAAGSEEERWLREEQRWLREEQRWLREEACWEAERRLMAAELALLKREMEHLRGQVQERRSTSLPSVVANLKQLVQSLPVSEQEQQPRPNIEFVHTEEEVEEIAPSVSVSSSVSISDHPSMLEFSIDLAPPEVPRTELRKGDDGDEVKALQEALEALGFYSGEEEIEYSMFEEGTETALKSWQASVGVREDGVASPKLLAILFGEETAEKPNVNGRKEQQQQSDPWKAPPSKAKASEKKSFAQDKLDSENTRDGEMAANRRVFLLGENRREEPGRLTPPRAAATKAGNGAPSSTPKAGNGAPSSTPASSTPALKEERCFTCKGEGVSMCTECEGTGILNVEDQFLDWVEEGANCPYCEGAGAIPCDVCSGRGAVSGAPV